MKIRVMSDLHLEFQNKLNDWLVPPLPHDQDTTLILAGDIALHKQVPIFLGLCSAQFKHVVYVTGNHEFYKANMPAVPGKIKAAIQHLPNVHFLDTDTVELDGVNFVGTTLWTDMDRGNELTMYYAKAKMSDYKVIRSGPPAEPWKWKLSPTETCALHRIQRDYMFDTINDLQETGKMIVAVSHHLPSFLCIAEHRRGADLNGAYASELYELIADSQPDLWVHGHTHDSVDIVPPGTNTRIVCNPRGYWPADLNPDFDPFFMVEI